jgi:Flp pilus assembly protein TadD
VENHCNLAIAQRHIGDFSSALHSAARACELNPLLPEAFNIKGAVHNDLGQTSEATASFAQALALKPDYAEATNNMGSALHQSGRANEAAPLFAKAVALEPYSIQFHQNHATNCLLRGDFETGWKEFEWRRYNSVSSLCPDGGWFRRKSDCGMPVVADAVGSQNAGCV